MSDGTRGSGVLPVRRIRFDYAEGTDPCWVPHRPEFSAAANAVSLGMPYAEPLFIRAVRSTFPELDEIDPALRARTETYIRQEVGHYTQHKRFNDLVSARYPATLRLQRWMDRYADWVWNRGKPFNVAYAAGGETISYGVARWAEKHLHDVFDWGDPVVASLYLWHLAEEIEHKASTYEVYEAVDGSRLRYTLAMSLGFLSLLAFTIVGMFMQLWHDKRLRRPATWFRMIVLSCSLAFVLLPVMAASAMPGHHPSDFSDPVFLPHWLELYDPDTGTVPPWSSRLVDG